jgi:hypothetical protein
MEDFIMLDLQLVSDFMNEHFERVSVSKNGTHFLARCLLCGDSKKNKNKRRFNLDYNGGNPIYHCFNCDASGSFLQLYSYVNGITIEEAKKDLYKYNPSNLIQKLSKKKKDKIIKEIEFENYNWILDDCISRDDSDNINGIIQNNYFIKLHEFINNRKIPDDFSIFIAYKGDYKSRIIIPIYDENNDITYFQARRIPSSGIEPKYKNPHIEKGNIILNKHNFDKNKYIIVTEGLIDAFMIGTQGTSCLGSSLTDSFLKEILNIGKVIVAFDNDETGYKQLIKFMKGKKKKGRKKPIQQNKYAKKIRYFLYPDKYFRCKDINNIVTEFGVKNVYELIVKNSYSYSAAYTMLHTKLKNVLK